MTSATARRPRASTPVQVPVEVESEVVEETTEEEVEQEEDTDTPPDEEEDEDEDGDPDEPDDEEDDEEPFEPVESIATTANRKRDAADTAAVTAQVIPALTPDEEVLRDKLLATARKCESSVDKFFECLVEIKEKQLYRSEGTMDAFVAKYFPKYGKRQFSYLLNAAETKAIAKKYGVDLETSQRALNPLGQLKEEKDKLAVVRELKRLSDKTGKAPVIEQTREIVNSHIAKGAKVKASSGGGNRKKKETYNAARNILEYAYSEPDALRIAIPKLKQYQTVKILDLLKGVPPNVLNAAVWELMKLHLVSGKEINKLREAEQPTA